MILFVITEVELEVKSGFRSHTVHTSRNGVVATYISIRILALVAEAVEITQTIDSCDLKCAGLTLITSEEVHQVNSTEQVSVYGTNHCTIRSPRSVAEISITLNSESEDRRNVLTDTETCVSVKILQPF